MAAASATTPPTTHSQGRAPERLGVDAELRESLAQVTRNQVDYQ